MNFKKFIVVLLLGAALAVTTACSGPAVGTPTRTPRAVAENNPTQTPWIIYVPITTTPEPSTVTPLPTVTSSKPTPNPTNTRAPTAVRPAATAPPQPTATATTAATAAPIATQPPSCGQTYQVTNLYWPGPGDTRFTKDNPGGNFSVQFKWTPIASGKTDPNLGYRIDINSYAGTSHTRVNGRQLYISHNAYLQVQSGNGAVIDPNGVYYLLPSGGENALVEWTVTVVMASGGFTGGPESQQAQGIVTVCGPTSAPATFNLRKV